MKGKGNHVVSLRIKIPTKLTDRQKKIFQELSEIEEPITSKDESKVNGSE